MDWWQFQPRGDKHRVIEDTKMRGKLVILYNAMKELCLKKNKNSLRYRARTFHKHKHGASSQCKHISSKLPGCAVNKDWSKSAKEETKQRVDFTLQTVLRYQKVCFAPSLTRTKTRKKERQKARKTERTTKVEGGCNCRNYHKKGRELSRDESWRQREKHQKDSNYKQKTKEFFRAIWANMFQILSGDSQTYEKWWILHVICRCIEHHRNM